MRAEFYLKLLSIFLFHSFMTISIIYSIIMDRIGSESFSVNKYLNYKGETVILANGKKTPGLSTRAFWYMAGRLILQGITLISAPIFTRMLSAGDYGKITVYLTWINILSSIGGLQTNNPMNNARVDFDERGFKAFQSNALMISTISFSVFGFVILFFQDSFAQLISLDVRYLPILVVHAFATHCLNFYTTYLTCTKQPHKYVIISTIVAVSSTVLSILLIKVMNSPVSGRILGMALPNTIVAILIIAVIFINGKSFFNATYWKFCLVLSLPLLLHIIASLIIGQSGTLIVNAYLDKSATGIYGFSLQMASVIDAIWVALNASWVPEYFDWQSKKDYNNIAEHATNYMVLFSSLTAGFMLLVPEVTKVLAPEIYWQGITVSILLAVGFYFRFLYGFPSNYEMYCKRNNMLSVMSIIGSALNLLFSFLLIPRIGLIGVGIASILSSAASFILHDCVARFYIKNFHFSWEFYAKGFIPVLIIMSFSLLTINYWFIRWPIAAIIGIALVYRIYKKRVLF